MKIFVHTNKDPFTIPESHFSRIKLLFDTIKKTEYDQDKRRTVLNPPLLVFGIKPR